ncbi:hypothetical protein A1O3_04926 [Capronia epimyces CBS 606.96]|uniref:Translation initiation factor 4E n=1 Tax=Capronia epimyces CBS 606.96 TaxID=1182542 RepID=W9YPS2_9EURO|nr:uncharacterized protein A1O3_04926 [Capronia epimyces CBS 606.96]EXJ84259.1 hypothetical protein A1O3_04926 [Capronia epimyces CBS 606.96]
MSWTSTGTGTMVSDRSSAPVVSSVTVAARPSPPRRSSSLHRVVITKLRPLPFQYRWSLWHSKPDDKDEYLLKTLVEDVADIGAFYRIFNNVPWNDLKQKDSLHIFRAGVKPLWEDAENQNGGRWLIRVRPENNRAVRMWEENTIISSACLSPPDCTSPISPYGQSKATTCAVFCCWNVPSSRACLQI